MLQKVLANIACSLTSQRIKHLFVCVCVCLFVCACVCTCMRVCACVCICVRQQYSQVVGALAWMATARSQVRCPVMRSYCCCCCFLEQETLPYSHCSTEFTQLYQWQPGVNWRRKCQLSMHVSHDRLGPGSWVPTPSLVIHGTTSCGVPVLPPGGLSRMTLST